MIGMLIRVQLEKPKMHNAIFGSILKVLSSILKVISGLVVRLACRNLNFGTEVSFSHPNATFKFRVMMLMSLVSRSEFLNSRIYRIYNDQNHEIDCYCHHSCCTTLCIDSIDCIVIVFVNVYHF